MYMHGLKSETALQPPEYRTLASIYQQGAILVSTSFTSDQLSSETDRVIFPNPMLASFQPVVRVGCAEFLFLSDI